ncbi:hypothetical protein AMECASPLE_007635 [Ameca splendens]|uniref:Uncharacterized protein n=1 Tax=Ameca splendens TaxID=208324 RepID=A0ABV0ZW05_9TELE
MAVAFFQQDRAPYKKAKESSGIFLRINKNFKIHGGPNLEDLKDQLLTFWCQIQPHTCRGLEESIPPQNEPL